MHGRLSKIYHSLNKENLAYDDIYKGIPNPFQAVRYHSLIIDNTSIMSEIIIRSKTKDNVIMGIQHKSKPIFGTQFHPEVLFFEKNINWKIFIIEHLHGKWTSDVQEFFKCCERIQYKKYKDVQNLSKRCHYCQK